MAQGVYRIPKIGYDVAVALTNTTTVGAFRGAGRPEAAALLERVIDLAAVELDIDPAELRRQNFLTPEQFPYETVVGTVYDCGDYGKPLDTALELAGYAELRAEQARRREAGSRLQLGIGLGSYVEVTAGGNTTEWGSVTVHEDGTATASAGTSGHGQGHPTSFAMLVSDKLGIPMESIKFVQSDTALVPTGGGTGGSRSLQLGGSAVYAAADKVLVAARELAADLLEASMLNPLIVRGQQHGGIAQGIAQALWEHFRYDADGNPITGTLTDYTIPTAAELPPYVVASTETPTPLNELGAKGIGEAATIGATPAVQNAVVDALSHLGVRHVDMPCTPERVWRALRAAGSPEADPWREPPPVFDGLPIRGQTEELKTADI